MMRKNSMVAALRIQQLKKTYASGTIALKGIDLTVAEGDFFGLLGQTAPASRR